MADGLFYNDTREPFCSADVTSVTLSTTAKALYPASNFPVLGGQYFARPGKAIRVRVFGRWTSDGTAGNGSFNVYYGSGGDAAGTVLMTGTAVAYTVSQTNVSFMAEVDVTCRTTGSAGTLFCTGFVLLPALTSGGVVMLPATAPAVSATLDLTAANIISVQALRSGAGVWTAQVHQIQVIALN